MSRSEFLRASNLSFETLEEQSALDRIRWAHYTYGDKLVLSTSFGIQSAVLLHMATQVNPTIPVVFVDTGYLFDETKHFRDELTQRLNLSLHEYRALRSVEEQEAERGHPSQLNEEQKIAFDYETKVEPFNRAVKELGAEAWIAGLRRGQSERRKDLSVTEEQDGILKLYPIIDWSQRDIHRYLTHYGLPRHPLFDEGYISVGNRFESQPGLQRNECGLHVPERFRPEPANP